MAVLVLGVDKDQRGYKRHNHAHPAQHAAGPASSMMCEFVCNQSRRSALFCCYAMLTAQNKPKLSCIFVLVGQRSKARFKLRLHVENRGQIENAYHMGKRNNKHIRRARGTRHSDPNRTRQGTGQLLATGLCCSIQWKATADTPQHRSRW